METTSDMKISNFFRTAGLSASLLAVATFAFAQDPAPVQNPQADAQAPQAPAPATPMTFAGLTSLHAPFGALGISEWRRSPAQVSLPARLPSHAPSQNGPLRLGMALERAAGRLCPGSEELKGDAGD